VLPVIAESVTARGYLKDTVDDKTALMAAIARVGDVTNGVLKDLVLRSAFAKDQDWWNKVNTEFKVTERYYKFEATDHNGDAVGVDNLIALPLDRAMDLCGYDVTHQQLGLNLLDLMSLDVDTFNKVEEWVHKYMEEQRKRQDKLLPKSMKDEMKG